MGLVGTRVSRLRKTLVSASEAIPWRPSATPGPAGGNSRQNVVNYRFF